MEVKSLNTPDETRTFEKGKLELVKTGGNVNTRVILVPVSVKGELLALHFITKM